MVNLEWYRTFKAIYEHGTLTKAATALYASQPGISLHLNSLEAYVGKKLFERTARKMVPTEDGQLMYDYLVEAMVRLEKAEQHFKKTSQEQHPTLHIGMCPETFQLVVEPEVPNLPFGLIARYGGNEELLKDLGGGILDMAILPQKSSEMTKKVNFVPFAKEKIVLIAGQKTDTAHMKAVIEAENWEELETVLRTEKWYSASREKEHFSRFWHNNFKKRQDFKPNYILPNISSIIRCLCYSDGLAVVPDFLCHEAIQSGAVSLVWEGHVPTENTLYFASRKGLKDNKDIAKIKQIFKEKMQAQPIEAV